MQMWALTRHERIGALIVDPIGLDGHKSMDASLSRSLGWRTTLFWRNGD